MLTKTRIKTKFSYNWNGKLNKGQGVRAFTTIRLHNPNKYFVGAVHEIILKEKELGEAEIKHVKTMYLDQLDAYTAWLDTGYDAGKTRETIRRMYQNKPEVGPNPLVDVSLMVWLP